MSPEPAVRAVHVSKRVRDGDRRVTVLEDVSLELAAGEIVAVSGPSGAGKTTLLAVLGGMLLPTEGEVFLAGEPVSRLRDAHRALVRRRTVGFVFQDLALVPELSVLANVTLSAVPDGVSVDEEARSLLSRFGIADRAASRASVLSGGEQQRVALARALVRAPRVLFLDEPTAHLDDARTDELLDHLGALAKDGLAICAASHDPRLRAKATRTVGLDRGRLVEAAP